MERRSNRGNRMGGTGQGVQGKGRWGMGVLQGLALAVCKCVGPG